MGERRNSALERIREIPLEMREDSPYKEVFRPLAFFFLDYFKVLEKQGVQPLETAVSEGNIDRSSILGALLERYREELKDFLYPGIAKERNSFGDFFSILVFLSFGIVLENKEEAQSRILELYLQIYLYSQSDEELERSRFQDIFYSHFYDYCRDFLEERYEEEEMDPFMYRNNILFFGWMPYYGSSPFFSKEYVESHQRDAAIFLGDRFLSHLYQAYEQQEKLWHKRKGKSRVQILEEQLKNRKDFQPENYCIEESQGLSFHAHQEKLWKIFLEKTKEARVDFEKMRERN
ncbi:hypothetical protein [Oribacterium sinus]|uniref:Uncharacterized protein n=1 Tax=Oribacterium sinus TaxID=237576 RepID=A0A930DK96_9FIRM|nr:hypothetical protein [Oribacterium sinus]MBF1272345.1 hypothetical protein [Oribacterium sinus]